MSKKSLIFNFVAHKGYYKSFDDKNFSKNQILFYAISQTYLPLLNMFANLEADGVPFKMGMTISPTLCAQLSNPIMQQNYINWLDRLIALGEKEVERYPEGSQKNILARQYLKKAKQDKIDYVETFDKNLLSRFSYYAKRGNLELFATCATYAFMPHIADFSEALNAQIEEGLLSHKHFFDFAPEGFYLPHLGYTNGIEKNLRAYGLNYTIIDSKGLLFADPEPKMGIFSPVRSESSFAFFACDSRIDHEILGKKGFMNKAAYRNQQKDIGYDSKLEDLSDFLEDSSERFQTGFKYSANDESDYDFSKAKDELKKDAHEFVEKRLETLNKAEEFCDGQDISLVCNFDADLLGERWYEGIDWLEMVFRELAKTNEITNDNFGDITKEQYQLESVKPAFSASESMGYGEILLDNTNDWMIRYLRKNTERMIDLADRFSEKTGLKSRALNLAAKEVLLSQSSDWPLMIHDKNFPDFAKDQFIKSINGFSTVYESLGSNSISTEWMTNLEREHDLFPWTNYMIFSKKQ
ncbi:MAG: DUF1957 domain-containing protein [Treponemataceae bacterium]|nr:DUF1957 domain-containing protein [Treponemataceae bacterium]